MTDIVVLGSGMAALGASYRLRQEKVPHVAYDMNTEPGGPHVIPRRRAWLRVR